MKQHLPQRFPQPPRTAVLVQQFSAHLSPLLPPASQLTYERAWTPLLTQLTPAHTLSISHSVARAKATVRKALFSQLSVPGQSLLTEEHQLLMACPHPLHHALYNTTPPTVLFNECLLASPTRPMVSKRLTKKPLKKKKIRKNSEYAAPIIFLLKSCPGSTELRYACYKTRTDSDKPLTPATALQEIQTAKRTVNLHSGESSNKNKIARSATGLMI